MDSQVLAAIVLATPPTLAVWASLRRFKRAEEAIGTPNGEGNLVKMSERILHGQAAQDERLANLEHETYRMHSRLAVVERHLLAGSDE